MTPTDRGSTPPAEAETAELAVVSEVGPSPLTVWLGSAMYTFPAGRDVTVGRDRDCDIWLRDTDPATFTLISRVHAILRFDGSHWLVVDKSQNGVFVGGARRSIIAIHDGQSIALGNPHGPQLTFRVPTATATPEPSNPPTEPSSSPTVQAMPSAPATGDSIHPTRFARPITPPPVRPPPPVRRIPPQPRPSEPDRMGRLGDTMRMLLPPRPGAAPLGSKTIGRSKANDVVVSDSLVSRVHAVLVFTPAGIEIRDNNSSNGTFVNGAPVTRALLREGDIVTIGNTDLVASGHTLVRRTAAARTRGLAAHGLGLTIDGHSLLTDVSFTARPGTLTAVIGPSGAGKSTLIKLIGGATQPSAGVVSFDGHDVHAEYASMRSRIGMVPQ
ncbi:MAG TPA: FHA domain-containing protein, partial [Mycobacterium sp.]|nr:FHA domain-containing protein [Mycobacterium sp.]